LREKEGGTGWDDEERGRKEGGEEENPSELEMSRRPLAVLIPPSLCSSSVAVIVVPLEWDRWREREEDVEGRGARLDGHGGENGKQESTRPAQFYLPMFFPEATS
jgi:hypothetical protein